MENILTIILIIVIVLFLSVIGLAIYLIYRLNHIKTGEISIPDNAKEFGALEAQLKNTVEANKVNTEVAMKNVQLQLMESNNKASEDNNAKLERFQKNITEQMDTKFNALNKQVDDKLSEINKKVEEKLSEGYKTTDKTMADLRERLQKIDDAQKNLEGLSGDVTSLKKVLEGNQSRGRYGEYQLSAILHDVFGDTNGLYEEQYTIRQNKTGGEDVRADAIVYTRGPSEFICIDSKFPFAEYLKMQDSDLSDEEKEKARKSFVNDVKKHITDISNKYIFPPKTTRQAIMFIPNDGVFAFIHHECIEVVEYARSKDVIITSPSTLQAILATLSMLRINYERSQKIDEITKQLSRLAKDFSIFAEEWDKLSRNIGLVAKNKEAIDTRVTKISDKFENIQNNQPELDYEPHE